MALSASRTRSVDSTSTSYSLKVGLTSCSGLYRLILSVTCTDFSSPSRFLVLAFLGLEAGDADRLLRHRQPTGRAPHHCVREPVLIVTRFEIRAVVGAAT